MRQGTFEANTLLIAREAIERFELDGTSCGGDLQTEPKLESALGDPTRWGGEHKLFAQFRRFHFAHTATTLASMQECDLDDNLELREDASNLGAFLYLIEQRYAIVYRRIVGSVRQVFPEFAGFSLQRSHLEHEPPQSALAAARA